MRTTRPRTAPPALRGLLPLLLCLPAALAAAAPAGPDSVLAVVKGPAGTVPREITSAQFVRAWGQAEPPVRPDSLTPEGARRFLDLLVGKEALGLMAAGEREPWTAQEEAGYEALRDQLVIRAMLDSALAATRAALGPAADTLGQQEVGVLTRERAVAVLGLVWDDSLAARLAAAFAALPLPSADSSAAAQLRALAALPAVDPADTGRVLARSAVGDYRANDLLGAWARLRPVYRPRIRTAAEVRDLVTNGLFERLLRRRAAGRGIEQRADVAERLAAERERIAVSRLVAREVYGRVPTDSLTLLRQYQAHEQDWAVPTRVRCLTVVLPSRAEAGDMALRLRDEARAESLAARARQAGSRWLRDVTAAGDSARFARLMRAGTGVVLGPDEAPDGWEVTRVMAVLPGHSRPFEDVRGRVLARWYEEDGERRMQGLLERARGAARVTVRPAALDRLLADPPAELLGPPPGVPPHLP